MPATKGQAPAGSDRRLLRRRADRRARDAAAGRASRRANAHIPVTAVAVGTPDGIVQQPVKGGYTERIQVPVQPTVLQAIAKASGGRFVSGRRSGRREVDLRRARLAGRPYAQDGRGDVAPRRPAASCSCSPARSSPGSGSGGSYEAAARRRSSRRSPLAAALAPAGAATNECRGITACIRVPGPWVLVPAHGTRRTTCSPARAAEASSAASTRRRARATCASSFDGRLGAPVSPGVTTTRYALFRAVSISGARADVPAAARLHPDAGRRRPLDRLGARHAGRAVARAALADRDHRAGPGSVREGRVPGRASSSSAPGTRSRSASSSRRRSVQARSSTSRARSSGARWSRPRSATDGLSIDVHRDRAGRRGVRAVSFVWPWFCSRSCSSSRSCSALALWLDRRRARYAVAFTNLDVLASVATTRAASVALGAARACSCSRSRRRRRRSRGRRRSLGAVGPRDDRAARRRLRLDARDRTSSRRGSAPRRTRWTSSPTRCRRA